MLAFGQITGFLLSCASWYVFSLVSLFSMDKLTFALL